MHKRVACHYFYMVKPVCTYYLFNTLNLIYFAYKCLGATIDAKAIGFAFFSEKKN
jgi:hypothetical protein